MNMELPEKLRLTDLRMKILNLVLEIDYEKTDNSGITKSLLEIMKDLEDMDKEASRWKDLMFKVANGIN